MVINACTKKSGVSEKKMVDYGWGRVGGFKQASQRKSDLSGILKLVFPRRRGEGISDGGMARVQA